MGLPPPGRDGSLRRRYVRPLLPPVAHGRVPGRVSGRARGTVASRCLQRFRMHGHSHGMRRRRPPEQDPGSGAHARPRRAFRSSLVFTPGSVALSGLPASQLPASLLALPLASHLVSPPRASSPGCYWRVPGGHPPRSLFFTSFRASEHVQYSPRFCVAHHSVTLHPVLRRRRPSSCRRPHPATSIAATPDYGCVRTIDPGTSVANPSSTIAALTVAIPACAQHCASCGQIGLVQHPLVACRQHPRG